MRGTGAPENEGQHLQNVYAPASVFGGPGRFGFRESARLTERSPLVTAARTRLASCWEPFWDLSKRVLVEKSPPNLIRMRFLQAVFPGARFVMIMRHPVVVAAATQKWSRTGLGSLIEHWLRCHELLIEDAPVIEHLCVVRYEDLVADPSHTLQGIYSFLNLEPVAPGVDIQTGLNAGYFDYARTHHADVIHSTALESRVRRFGYRLRSLRLTTPRSRARLYASVARRAITSAQRY